MPELPEVETVCQALKPVLEGQSILKVQLNRLNLRYPFPPNLSEELTKSNVSEVKRRAKYLLINFEHGLTLIWHLGMSGNVVIERPDKPFLVSGPHDHVIMTTSKNYRITYRDPRRFGFLTTHPTKQIQDIRPFNSLGPEPLNNPLLTSVLFYNELSRRSIPIKNALLDQKLIAGVGNIYASEALWRAKISPLRLANSLTIDEAEILLREIRNVLIEAIAAGGSTLRDHKQPNGKIGYFQHAFNVYHRAEKLCGHCHITPVRKIVQSGRATYYCPVCQL
jgi:formamidopyrimidine-DNA glycosylase